MTDKSATLAEQPPEPHAAVAGDVAVAAPRPRLGGLAGAIWAARSFWLALLGILFALNGQMLLVQHQPSVYAIRWYAAGLILLFVAWWGTYRNKSLLRVPEAAHTGTLPTRAKASEAASRPSRFPAWTHVAARYGVALLSLGLNLYSVSLLRSDYYSTVGSLSWLASLALLLAAFAGYRPRPGIDPDPPAADVEDRTDWRLPRRAELAVFLAILALGLFLRFYRLDDWNTGVFGDEGEAGTDALGIYEGNAVSPFEIGWFEQPNFYYWGIALGMKLFGPGLLGLRFFSAVAGSLMLLPFYPLVRLWFGVRAAIIATTLLAVSDVTIHFTRIELSNITTPLSLVLGFYFLFRGLRSRRVLEFVLSGYGFMLGLYFYSGARLTPYMLAAVLAYIFILLPLVRLPGVFRRWRQEEPGESPVRSLGRAALTQLRGVSHYGVQITALVIACVAFASPWYVYYTDHRTTMDSRTVDKLVFNQPQRMIDQYGVRHEPLFLGLRLPTSDDIYPVLPAAFEQTSLSVKLADDGFWPRVLWNQLTTTLSIFTMRHESCGFYSYTNEPIAKPLEAVLIVLGIAWALLARHPHGRAQRLVLVHYRRGRRANHRRSLHVPPHRHRACGCHIPRPHHQQAER
jgi:hypothetical protein